MNAIRAVLSFACVCTVLLAQEKPEAPTAVRYEFRPGTQKP